MSTSCLTLPILPILHVQNEIFLSKVLITILPALPDYLLPKNTDSMPQDLPYLGEEVDEGLQVLAVIRNVNCDVEEGRVSLSYPVENADGQ